MLRKKKLSYIALSLITAFSLIGSALGTMSWFVTTVETPKYNISGASAGAYFAYGDGSAEKPFGISIKRHLYNLAWLQYMGQFKDKQYYFELSNSVPDTGLDMDGYCLPPIGTEDNPFVGNFNGNGKIIKNLTITNDKDAIFNSEKHPDQTQVTYTAPEIVGFFGVVGNLDGAYKGTYDSSVNTIYDLGITDFTIQTTTEKALVGMAAGYVDGVISNVAVNDSTINVTHANTQFVDKNLTTNLSDYSVVGYVTDKYRGSIKEVEKDLYDVNITTGTEYNATDEGDSQGWGGSINMKTIYYRLYAIKKNKASNIESNFYWRQNKYYYDDELKDSETTGTNTLTANSDDSGYTPHLQRYNGSERADHQYIGNYNYFHRRDTLKANTTYSTTDQSYLYLCGGHYENRTYNTYYEHVGVRISDGNGHYLTSTNVADNGSVSNTNTEDDAIVWIVEDGNTPRIYTQYNGNNIYLYRYNDTTLRLTTTVGTATRWNKEVNATTGGIRYTSNNRMIAYSGGTWTLVAATVAPTYPTLPVDPYAEPTFDETEPPVVANPGARPTMPTAPEDYGYQLKRVDNNNFLIANNGNLGTNTNPFKPGWTVNVNNQTTTIVSGNYKIQVRYQTWSYSLSLTTGTYSQNNRKTTFNVGTSGSTYSFSATVNNQTRYVTTGTTPASNAVYFEYERYALYKGEYMLYDDAMDQYEEDCGDVADAQAQWDDDKAEYDQYLIDKAAYDAAYDAWEAEHDQWEADNYYRETTFPSLVTQYNTDLAAYNNTFNITFTNVTAENPVRGPDYHQTSEDSDKSSAEDRMYYDATDTTYFPLNVESDIDAPITNGTNGTIETYISNGNLDPKTSNTGYIISGSNLTASGTYKSGNSNIRVSEYPSNDGNYNISNSFKSTYNTLAKFPDSAIKTITLDGTETNMGSVYNENNYPRYKESKRSFYENSLTTAYNENTGTYTLTNTVYGLHFMDSTISTNSLVNAQKVSILGNKCDTYQFPVDCIDFNLKQKGVINFFAGSYFSGNNSFFSIYQIFRNDDATGYNSEANTYTMYNTINNLKQITEVWSNDVGTKTTKYSNIYKYSDGTYSRPYRFDGNQNKYVMNPLSNADNTTAYTFSTMDETNQSDMTELNNYISTYGYTQRFASSQIGKRQNTYALNYIYYFEFPMNAGEYCLGSVTGGTGAYLLYLDIGANAAKTRRTEMYEHYREIEKIFNFPEGIALNSVAIIKTNITNETSLDATDSTNFVIYYNTSGSLKLSRNGNDITVTRSGGFTSNAKPTLVGDNMWDDEHHQYNIHLPDGGDNLTSEITAINITKETTSLTYFDYNVNLDELTKTVFSDTYCYTPITASYMDENNKNVNGIHYYYDYGYIREVALGDLPNGTIANTSSYYTYNENSKTYSSASGASVNGTIYYKNIGTQQSPEYAVVTLADLATGLVDASNYLIRKDGIADSTSGSSVKGISYYSYQEVMIADLESGTVSVSSFYTYNGSAYSQAAGNNVNGTTYYVRTGTEGNYSYYEASLADLTDGTIADVSSYLAKDNSVFVPANGSNINGTKYYAYSEITLADLPSDAIADVTSYYIYDQGEDAYVHPASGGNVNGTKYYFDSKGKDEVKLSDLPTGTVNDVSSYLAMDSSGRVITQYYQNGAYTNDLDSMKVYNADNNGIKYSSEDLMSTTMVSTENVNGNKILIIDYRVENGFSTHSEWVLEEKVNSGIANGPYYTLNDYRFDIEVVGGELTINIKSFGYSYEDNGNTVYVSDVIIINDLSTVMTGDDKNCVIIIDATENNLTILAIEMDGTINYFVFDPNHIDIEGEYNLFGLTVRFTKSGDNYVVQVTDTNPSYQVNGAATYTVNPSSDSTWGIEITVTP